MKKYLCILIILLLAASLGACSSPRDTELPPSPAQTASSVPSETVTVSFSPTVSPSHSPSPLPPEPEPSSVPPFEGFIEPDDSTVVIADSRGMVYFGYSGGRWLTHSQAAAYCEKKMKLYIIGINGANGYVTSSEAAENPDMNWDESSWAKNGSDVLYDSNISYILKLKGDPKSLLCRIEPARVPNATTVKDTSALLPALQALADKQFGAGKVKVQITSAVSVDIDDDGNNETLVNASNNEYDRYETFEIQGYWYSIACVIEEDGSYAFIEERYEDGFREESGFVAVDAVLDIDGDGVCEFLVRCEGWEYWGMYICSLDNGSLDAAAGYYWSP